MKASTVYKECCSGHLRASFILGEIKELVEANSLAEFTDELCDVYTGLILVVYEVLGVDLTIHWMPTVNKWRVRNLVWKEIFRKEGLEFHPRYLSGGSNWEKPAKVRLALSKAREDQRCC